MGSGRNPSTTPSTTSRAFAESRMLLVDALLHAEAEPDPHPPRVDRPVLDHGGDAGDPRRPDAVDRLRPAPHREAPRGPRRGPGRFREPGPPFRPCLFLPRGAPPLP